MKQYRSETEMTSFSEVKRVDAPYPLWLVIVMAALLGGPAVYLLFHPYFDIVELLGVLAIWGTAVVCGALVKHFRKCAVCGSPVTLYENSDRSKEWLRQYFVACEKCKVFSRLVIWDASG